MWTGKRCTGRDIARAISTLRQFWCRSFNLSVENNVNYAMLIMLIQFN